MMDKFESRYPWKLLGIVMLGTLMASLDSSIVNVSLPVIMGDFHTSIDTITWVITAYMLAFAAFMPLTTWFRDYVGHKKLYIGSLAIFTLGSVLCGFAWSMPALIAARIIQAIGGAALTPTGMAMISEEFPPEKRAKALAYWGMGVIIGPAFGPTLGGWLTSVFGWRSIFLVNLPIGLLGIWLGMRVLRHDVPHPSQRKPFDVWGFLSLALFLVCFLLGLSYGDHEGWTSGYIEICFILAGAGLLGFIVAEHYAANRIMDFRLFEYPVYAASMAVTAIRSAALFGGVFLMPLFLQQVRGLNEIDTGLLMLPGSLVIGIMMPFTPKIMKHVSPRIITLVGLLGVAAFMWMYHSVDAKTSVWNLILPTLIRGVGLGLLFTPVTTIAMNSIPTPKVTMGASMLNLIQQVAGSVGIAVLATIFSHRVTHYLAKTGKIGAEVLGFQDTFLVGTAIVLTGMIAAFFLPSQPPQLTGHKPLIMND